jgi:hypothetical protein
LRLFYQEVFMPSWEEELAVLLRELGVKQEEPKAHLRPTRRSKQNNVKRREQFADARFWIEASQEGDDEDDDAYKDDLSMVRREVDAIVNQVMHLMQRGNFDPSLKEDIMVVWRALRRRASVTQQAAATEEAYLESATAMLHFCRLILQLSGAEAEG